MVERTCLDCGETWTLKASLAHGRHKGIGQRGLTAGTVMGAHGNPGAVFGPGMQQQMAELHRRDAAADQDLDAHRQLESCPKCGSERFTERRARRR
jgi:hypothetical protein